MAITKYYAMGESLLQYGQKDGVANPNATTMQQMQDFMVQEADTLAEVVKPYLWQPSTAYVVGAEVRTANMPAGYHAECTTAGTSGTNEPTWSTSYETFQDGGVVWTLVSQKEQIATKVDKTNPTDSEGKALATQEYVDNNTFQSDFYNGVSGTYNVAGTLTLMWSAMCILIPRTNKLLNKTITINSGKYQKMDSSVNMTNYSFKVDKDNNVLALLWLCSDANLANSIKGNYAIFNVTIS